MTVNLDKGNSSGSSDGANASSSKTKKKTMRFKNPSNGYIEETSSLTWLWVFLFGCFYFAFKGVWTHAVISFVAAFLTGGLAWLVYPFFAPKIMRNHYLKKGWVEV